MLSLRGLRLNCWLAGCVPGVLAAVLLLLLGDRIGAVHRQAYAQGLQTVLEAHASHHARPAQVHADPAVWTGAAHLLIDADGSVRPRDSQGQLDMNMLNPDPQVFDAVTHPQVWDGPRGQVRAAVALWDANGDFQALLYAEAHRTLEEGRNWIALVATLVLALSAAMGWYLVRRVYRPVEDLCVQAEAALRGRAIAPRYRSRETDATASAVSALATAYLSDHQSPVVQRSAPAEAAGAQQAGDATGKIQELTQEEGDDTAESDPADEPRRSDPGGDAAP